MTKDQNDECDFEVTQDGVSVASGTGTHDAAVAEATHYAMTYGQDGPVEWKVYRVTRSPNGRRKRKEILHGSMSGVSMQFVGASK